MEMYEHSLIYGHVKFTVWVYWDKKERICCFSTSGSRIDYQSKDSFNLLILAKKKGGGMRKKKNIPLKLSYNLYVKKMYVLSAM